MGHMTNAANTAAKNLNKLIGSSLSGNFLVLDLSTGELGDEVYTARAHPQLARNERLVKIGRRYFADDFADDDQ
jgi:hypothetical protein